MRRLAMLIAPLIVLSWATAASASMIQVGSLVGNDFVDWQQLTAVAAEGANLGSPRSFNTDLGRTGSASSTELEWFQEGSLWLGDFNVNDYLLSADGQSLTLDFNTAVAGVGAAIQSTAFGDFTAELELFDSASTSLGTFLVTGNNAGAEDGSNPFLGVRSSAADISRAVFTITANTFDFGLGLGLVTLSDTPTGLQPVPEPTSMLLVGTGIAGVVARARRRRQEQPHMS